MKRKLLDIARRLLILLLVVWTVVSLVTILIELVPGDPAAAILGDQARPEDLAAFRTRHGLDRPAFFFTFPEDARGERTFRWHGWDNRYVEYWRGILKGDMVIVIANSISLLLLSNLLVFKLRENSRAQQPA